MSDDEYEFQYSDDEDQAPLDADDSAVKIENLYYNSKGLKDSDPGAALAGFQELFTLAQAGGADQSDWAFKALKQIVKLHLRRGESEKMVAAYAQLLQFINAAAVTKNRAEKAINGILDRTGDNASLGGIYTVTLNALESTSGNERLLFKTRMKLARVYLAKAHFGDLAPLLEQLQAALQQQQVPSSAAAAAAALRSGGAGAVANAEDAKGKATQLLEIYALKIQMYTAMRDFKRLTAVHAQALAVMRSAVPHPAILGIIHECGAKLLMPDRRWEEARVEFLAAFKAFEEAGSGDRTIACLRYHLLANMLAESKINPFDSQDTKAYEKHPKITTMTSLTSAYLAGDMAAFEPVLRNHAEELGQDDVLSAYLGDLLQGMRTQVLVSFVAPYSRLRLQTIAAHFGVSVAEAEGLAVMAIRDGRLQHAAIDQVGQLLLLRQPPEQSWQGAVASADGKSLPPPTRGGGSGSARASAAPVGAGAEARYTEMVRLGDQLDALLGALAGSIG